MNESITGGQPLALAASKAMILQAFDAHRTLFDIQGVRMAARPRCRYLALEELERRDVPSLTLAENFDFTTAGSLPSGWSEWSSNAVSSFAVSSQRAVSPTQGLVSRLSNAQTSARTWADSLDAADVRVGVTVFVNSTTPAQLFARGINLDRATPTFYAVSVSRGLNVELLRVDQGISTTLARVASQSFFSGKWLRIDFTADANALRVEICRPDTGQYLDAAGAWQATPIDAIELQDGGITQAGKVGLARPAKAKGNLFFDDFRAETIDHPPPIDRHEPFDTTAPGSLPPGWLGWSSNPAGAFQVSTGRSLSGANGLAVTASLSNTVARAWLEDVSAADVQVSASVYLDTLIPVRILARGTNLNGPALSFYAVEVARGLDVRLLKVVNGVATTLASLRSTAYFSAQWARVTLHANGTSLRAQVSRLDTGQYLDASGNWVNDPTWALSAADAELPTAGRAGVERPASYTGTVTLDDFTLLPASGDSQPPQATLVAPAGGSTLTGVVAVGVSISDNVDVRKTEFYVDGVLRHVVAGSTAATAAWDFDTSSASNGAHTLTVRAYDGAGNVGLASITITTQNDTALSRPDIPRHYPHIRIAQLAYRGTPFAEFEDQLLRDSVDLVVSAAIYHDHINAVAPNTPQLIYSNVSNLYLDLLLDWLNYADLQGVPREAAFYHAAAATPFSGDSPSSQPVSWFWRVDRSGPVREDLTSRARGVTPGGVTFAPAGEAIYLAYPDRFGEINLDLAAGAAGWTGMLEYVAETDPLGQPVRWEPLPLLADGTAGLTQSGRIAFAPPADWVAARIDDPYRMYEVRIRTVTDGARPVARTILGRDYVNAQGSTTGVIPVFDPAADRNNDGYLDEIEWSDRSPGKDARFLYESRLFHGFYGQMRFATNPANLGVRQWTVDYHLRYLGDEPGADGLFMDNSGGNLPLNGTQPVEPIAAYATDYATMLNAIARAVAPRWVLANTAGGGSSADTVVARVQGYYEEFALRPLAHNYQQFEELAATITRRTGLQSPAPLAVIDSLPTGGSPTDPRTQLTTLAAYYLLADPETTFLNFYGGFEPASAWARHWVQAAAFDVGLPTGPASLFASGADPSNGDLTYRVYGRSYDNALMLYKPLSYGGGVSGSLGDETATTHLLPGTFRVLQADGSLGDPLDSITLRNGEGVVLVVGG